MHARRPKDGPAFLPGPGILRGRRRPAPDSIPAEGSSVGTPDAPAHAGPGERIEVLVGAGADPQGHQAAELVADGAASRRRAWGESTDCQQELQQQQHSLKKHTR